MKAAIAALTEDGQSVEGQLAALEALQKLVEPIDNANGGCHY